MTSLNLPAPIRRGYADADLPIIDEEQINEMSGFLKTAIGMLITELEITSNGNLRVQGQDANGGPVDVTLSLASTVAPSREIHLLTNLVYNQGTATLEGPLALSDTTDVALGNLLIFITPSNLPSNSSRVYIEIDGLAGRHAVRGYSGGVSILTYADMIPSRIYWGIVGNGIQLLTPAGELSVIKRTSLTITNAELKTLDTDYIELVPAPGASKFLSVQLVSITKIGDDVPPTQNPRKYYVAISEDGTLTEAEVAAGNSQTYTFVTVPTWSSSETRFIFLGVPDDRRDIISINVSTTEESEDFFVRVFERVPGTVDDADGIPVKWWRTKIAYDSPGDAFAGQDYVTGWGNDENVAILEDIIRYSYAGLIQVHDQSISKPLYANNEEFAWIHGHMLNALLVADDDTRFLGSVGGHDLNENTALSFAMIVNGFRPQQGIGREYGASIFDTFMEPVDDVSLEIVIRFQILEI